MLVLGIAKQASDTSKAAIPQVYVVTATRDLPDGAQFTPDALVVRPFPTEFAPPASVANAEQIVGKFALGPVFKDQIIQVGQVATTKRTPILSDRVPPGKVAVWFPIPNIVAGQVAFKPGDRVDVLLSLPMTPGKQTSSDEGGEKVSLNISTQTTLQNVEVFAIGEAAAQAQTSRNEQQPANNVRPAGSAPVAFLVDHQDAVLLKFIKDSGGTIDFALRSSDEERIVRTDAVTVDLITERFRFRVPQSVAQTGEVIQP